MTISPAARPAALALSFALVSLASPTPLAAQCAQWGLGGGAPGVDGPQNQAPAVYATAWWDADGSGPAQPVLVVGGSFAVAGGTAASNIALHDPASGSWIALGTGTNGPVRAIAVLPNNDLVIGGAFTTAGGLLANRIASWNGTAWATLGTGMLGTSDAEVRALAVLPTGELAAAGWFSTAGGGNAKNIASWNGAAWSPLGTGLNLPAWSLAVNAMGRLVAGGDFIVAGGALADHVAEWDGLTWAPLNTGMSGTVRALVLLPNGHLAAAGTFDSAGGAVVNNVTTFDGVAWNPLGSGITGFPGAVVNALVPLPNGDLIAGGQFTAAGGTGAPYLARWSNGTWSSLGATVSQLRAPVSVHTLASSGNDLFVGGRFAFAANTVASNIARFDGSQWFALAAGTAAQVLSLAEAPNGDLVAGGDFFSIEGVAAQRIARWNGAIWSPLGTGLDDYVYAVAFLPNGDLVAGGAFTDAGGVTAAHIARWDGATWHPLGAGVDPLVVYALTVLPNGDLIAGGFFGTAGGAPASNVARWDGASWHPLGAGVNGTVSALAALPNGDVIAAGAFTLAGGAPAARIARWNGSSWSPLGSGLSNVCKALCVLDNGDVVAGGYFTGAGGAPASNIARWNGSSWSPLGAGVDSMVTSLAVMPDGDLMAGGLFASAGGAPARSIARWNGSSWSPLGAGTDAGVHALLLRRGGELTLGGAFSTADGSASAFLAHYVSTCLPTATSFASGCASSGGANVLTAASLPWVDATFRARGTGLPNLCVALALTSFAAVPQGVAPLASFFVQSPPGCDLLVAPDIVHAIGTATGTVESQLFLPNVPPLVGTAFYHQMIPLEVDASLNIVSITATNSLRLVAGDF